MALVFVPLFSLRVAPCDANGVATPKAFQKSLNSHTILKSARVQHAVFA
jgi:hypothetical protein